MEKDYYLVVLDYDLNYDEAALAAVKPYADRIEMLVNEVCYPGCPKRTERYLQQSRPQLEYDISTPFPCPNLATPRKICGMYEQAGLYIQ